MNRHLIRAARTKLTGINTVTASKSFNTSSPAAAAGLQLLIRQPYQICKYTSGTHRHLHKTATVQNLPNNTTTSFRHQQQQQQQFTNFAKSEYIHPLSQIVLEHLQSSHSEWIRRMGLDKGLELKKDGTFVLRFGNNGGDADGGESESKSGQQQEDDEVDSIWTMYEPTEKKHYLCLSKSKLVGRYLLQDNTKPAWHTDKRSIPERVQDAVDEMVAKVDEMGC